NCRYSVVRIVVGGAEQLGHASIHDHIFLASGALALKHAREQQSGLSSDVATGLDDQLEVGALHDTFHQFRITLQVQLGITGRIRYSKTASKIQKAQSCVTVLSQPLKQFPDAIDPRFQSIESRELGSNMHVEPNQLHSWKRAGKLRNVQNFVIGNAELVSATPGADVRMCGFHIDFGVYTKSHARRRSALCRNLRDKPQFMLRLDIEQQHPGIECFANLGSRLSHSAEYDVRSAEPCPE